MSDNGVTFTLRLSLDDGAPRGALFSRGEIDAVAEEVSAAAARVEAARGPGPLGFLELPYAYGEEHGATIFGDLFWGTLPRIEEAARRIRQDAATFFHLGIGGSALGAMTLVNALGPEATGEPGGAGGEIHVLDNVDPDWIGPVLCRADLTNTYANVVSKSGGTVETIATFAVLLERMRREAKLPEDVLKRRIFVTTNPEKGALLELARKEGFQVLPLPDVVHGRFSVFSPMGLFAAAVAGVDVAGLLAGARRADEVTAREPFRRNMAWKLAALHYLGLRKKGIKVLVLLPYSNRLRLLADWYSQLVAESLGKDGQGLTPVKALGVTDQHSQLQLYNDGPKDKLVVFFSVAEHREALPIPDAWAEGSDYSYLKGHSLADLLRVEREATEVSLHAHGVPSCRFGLPRIDAFNVGFLLGVLSKTVCILGELLGVDAFDQPGVEESKEYARAMLGKAGKGYEELRENVERAAGEEQEA
jgi:glucose-6-phosphate isomerase